MRHAATVDHGWKAYARLRAKREHIRGVTTGGAWREPTPRRDHGEVRCVLACETGLVPPDCAQLSRASQPSASQGGSSRSSPKGRRWVLALTAVCGVVMVALVGCGGGAAAPSASVVERAHVPVPAQVADLPLVDQRARTVTLASFRGRVVLLVPFLTLCQEVCPMTTGNLLTVQRALRADGAAGKVEIVELSVDPERDSPARLAAYAQLTGASWELVTESPSELAQIARFFGFWYQRVPEGNPPAIDWWTGKPLTYDIDHSDGFVVIDQHGVERFFTAAPPNFHGRLVPRLASFLDAEGRHNLADPPSQGWAPASALQAIGAVLHRALPLAHP
jgi:cytochrome oxidase Cu insertion factor (SCO1/SenC/PrrC family)